MIPESKGAAKREDANSATHPETMRIAMISHERVPYNADPSPRLAGTSLWEPAEGTLTLMRSRPVIAPTAPTVGHAPPWSAHEALTGLRQLRTGRVGIVEHRRGARPPRMPPSFVALEE